MGDAGSSSPASEHTTRQIRELHVLVTGFGPFKTFTNNPSWLIASSLPVELSSSVFTDASRPILQSQPRTWASQISGPAQPLRKPDQRPYKIIIHTYPEPVRVAYSSTAVLIPALLDPSTNAPFRRSFDYVLHIGLASGRNSYTLETNAHRDHYDIPDVDDAVGKLPGEAIWKRNGVPDQLWVGWNLQDVETRWNENVRYAEEHRDRLDIKTDMSNIPRSETTSPPVTHPMSWKPRWSVGSDSLLPGMLVSPATTSTNTQHSTKQKHEKAVVRLSRDAGRFLCEFILMSSLSYLWQDAQKSSQTTAPNPDEVADDPREKVGKVAFLHVPNGTQEWDVARGRLVAESAIQALVASWEAGYRNPNVYTAQGLAHATKVPVEQTSGGFEAQGTGDS